MEILLKWILFIVLRLLSWSYRFKVQGLENYIEAQNHHPLKSYLLVFWHEQLLSPLFYFEGKKHSVVVSDSRDGAIITYQCHKWGYSVVRGSQNRDGKDKGGLRALIGMLAELKKGTPVALTVDGSVGPRRYVKAGVFDLARKSECAILPLGAVASRYWTLKTWDQFKIPKPFASIVIQFGKPLIVSPHLQKGEIPTLQEKLGEILNEQETLAQSYFEQRKIKIMGKS